MEKKSVYLVLENGTVFCGKCFGYEAEVFGEIVFTTASGAYMTTLTDSGYKGQMLVQTFPLIGNYGIVSEECESKGATPSVYIVRELCQEPSNFRCEGALGVFLNDNKIVCITDIDTRRLTRIIRENGSMKAKVTFEKPEDIKALTEEIKKYKYEVDLAQVSVSEPKTAKCEGALKKVALLDLGAADSIISNLTKRGCEVTVFPYNTPAEEILAYKPDGVVLSNGPVADGLYPDVINEIQKLAWSGISILGICLGHLLLAAARGYKVAKLTHAHRGGQPSVRLSDKRVFITSQITGYAIDENSLDSNVSVTFKNGNDGTVEGIEYKDIKAFSVQFRPGASGGPNRTDFIYDKFIETL